MNAYEVFEYIRSNKISTPELSKLSGVPQSTIWKAVYKNAKMSYDKVLLLEKAVNKLAKSSENKNKNIVNDELLVNFASEDEPIPYSNRNELTRDQAKALKMSSEHIGILLNQVSMLLEENKELKDQLNKIQKELWESKVHA